MRTMIVIAGIYTVLLLLYTKVKEERYTTAIEQSIEDQTKALMLRRPVHHRYTFFSEMLAKQAKANSPFNLRNLPDNVNGHELVIMSPCNPRIQSCS
ncbi:MAG: hypothetical protein AB8B97_26820 [Granulosicoccus sp.]